jgi:hypothetical protein
MTSQILHYVQDDKQPELLIAAIKIVKQNYRTLSVPFGNKHSQTTLRLNLPQKLNKITGVGCNYFFAGMAGVLPNHDQPL